MKITGIVKSFSDLPVLENVSFDFPLGCTAVTGASGCGKTTLLRILAGLEQPDRGQIEGIGRVSFVFQEDRLIQHETVEQNLRMVCRDPDRLRAALRTADLSEFADARVHTLSGGMGRRVAFLRGALFEADTLLLDEPFNGVDPERRDALARWLRALWRGRRVIAVSHETDDLRRLGAVAELHLGNG